MLVNAVRESNKIQSIPMDREIQNYYLQKIKTKIVTYKIKKKREREFSSLVI